MRAVIQRVLEAQVVINGNIHSEIQKGLVVFIGIEEEDNEQDLDWLAAKIIHMRLFSDEQLQMNLSLQEVKGSLMIISQFTLLASTKKGNRPGFTRAARGPFAEEMYNCFISKLRAFNLCSVHSGVFGADMKVQLINDGPVTLCVDSKNKE